MYMLYMYLQCKYIVQVNRGVYYCMSCHVIVTLVIVLCRVLVSSTNFMPKFKICSI